MIITLMRSHKGNGGKTVSPEIDPDERKHSRQRGGGAPSTPTSLWRRFGETLRDAVPACLPLPTPSLHLFLIK